MKVTGNQYTTDNCFICGEKNVAGVKMRFYNLEDGRCVGLFTAQPCHCSYPDRVHGGVVSAILDETIGRAILPVEPDCFGVTGDLKVRFKKPVPLGVELRCVGRITANNRRLFEGEGEILLPDGAVAAQGSARYMKVSLASMGTEFVGSDAFHDEAKEDDPVELDIE